MATLNLLPYGDTAPMLAAPPRHAASGHALIGRVTLGRDGWFGAGSVIRADGHDVTAGDDLQLGRGASVHIAHAIYPTLIGHGVTVGGNAVVHACTVHDGAVLEEDSVVLDGSVVGAGVVLEAGSVVFPRSELTPNTLYAGKPAKPVRELSAAEIGARRSALRARNEGAPHDWSLAGAQAAQGDPSAFVANTALLRGRVIAAAQSSIWYGCRLDAAAGDIVIGARSNVQDNAILTAGADGIHIGVDTTLGHNVLLADCSIGDRCLIGIGSRVAAGTVAQDDSFLAAGAVTTRGQVLTGGWLWGGAPARKLAPLDERKKALVLGTIVTYCEYARDLAAAQADARRRAA
ncbi:MAG: gamma carbonic anhydrase family protein [Burkholderiaceae bacterium]|jgi:carbonic anhydrase/acetyltransferase-like protein (isoleucine patch superfamily)|nr:gamma carbonic anhydrase family protein [Burkholderiaceae bacterium]